MPAQTRIPNNLSTHEHAFHLYRSKETLLEVMVPYILYGLAHGEKCLYAADDSAPDDFRDGLSLRGCDVSRYEKSEQLEILSTRKTYFGFGMFSGAAMLAYYRAYIPATLGRRFRSLRVAVEIGGALADIGATHEFSIYELRANELFPNNPVSAVCAYNTDKFPASFLNNIAESHPYRMEVECPYLSLKKEECFHTGNRSDTCEQAARYCFDSTQQFRLCPVFQEFESNNVLGEKKNDFRKF